MILKRAALIVLDNPCLPWSCLFQALVAVLCTVLAAPPAGFCRQFSGASANCFYHELMVKYTEVEEDNTLDAEGEDEE